MLKPILYRALLYRAQVTMSIPESPAMVAMEALQRRIDDHIQRKRSAMREAMVAPEHPKRRIRLYVSNSHHHQPHNARQSSHHHHHHHGPSTSSSSSHAATSEPPCWTLLISGRVMEAEQPVAPTAPIAPDASAAPAGDGVYCIQRHGTQSMHLTFAYCPGTST